MTEQQWRISTGPYEFSSDGIWARSPWNAKVKIATISIFSPMNGINWQTHGRMFAASYDLAIAADLYTKAAHEVRDLLNARGIPCPASIALAAEKARQALAKLEPGAS